MNPQDPPDKLPTAEELDERARAEHKAILLRALEAARQRVESGELASLTIFAERWSGDMFLAATPFLDPARVYGYVTLVLARHTLNAMGVRALPHTPPTAEDAPSGPGTKPN